jgi:hypothetical protein
MGQGVTTNDRSIHFDRGLHKVLAPPKRSRPFSSPTAIAKPRRVRLGGFTASIPMAATWLRVFTMGIRQARLAGAERQRTLRGSLVPPGLQNPTVQVHKKANAWPDHAGDHALLAQLPWVRNPKRRSDERTRLVFWQEAQRGCGCPVSSSNCACAFWLASFKSPRPVFLRSGRTISIGSRRSST